MSRLAKNTATYAEVGGWFDAALNSDDPRPTADVLDYLARELQTLLNRANNAEHQRAGSMSPSNRKDESLEELRLMRVHSIAEAARPLIVAVSEYQMNCGDVLPYPGGDVFLPDLEDILRRMSFFAGSPRERSNSRGRKPVSWRDAARKFGRLVEKAMRDAGYRGRKKITDSESVTAIVTAAAIEWAYEIKLAPSGLVSAMRDRERSKSNAAEARHVLNRAN